MNGGVSRRWSRKARAASFLIGRSVSKATPLRCLRRNRPLYHVITYFWLGSEIKEGLLKLILESWKIMPIFISLKFTSLETLTWFSKLSFTCYVSFGVGIESLHCLGSWVLLLSLVLSPWSRRHSSGEDRGPWTPISIARRSVVYQHPFNGKWVLNPILG